MQRWRFLLILDPNTKKTVGAYYKRALEEQVGLQYHETAADLADSYFA